MMYRLNQDLCIKKKNLHNHVYLTRFPVYLSIESPAGIRRSLTDREVGAVFAAKLYASLLVVQKKSGSLYIHDIVVRVLMLK